MQLPNGLRPQSLLTDPAFPFLAFFVAAFFVDPDVSFFPDPRDLDSSHAMVKLPEFDRRSDPLVSPLQLFLSQAVRVPPLGQSDLLCHPGTPQSAVGLLHPLTPRTSFFLLSVSGPQMLSFSDFWVTSSSFFLASSRLTRLVPSLRRLFFVSIPPLTEGLPVCPRPLGNFFTFCSGTVSPCRPPSDFSSPDVATPHRPTVPFVVALSPQFHSLDSCCSNAERLAFWVVVLLPRVLIFSLSFSSPSPASQAFVSLGDSPLTF